MKYVRSRANGSAAKHWKKKEITKEKVENSERTNSRKEKDMSKVKE